MRYFKVIKGFRSDEFIPITEDELDKAIYAHMTGKVVAFANGSINGDSINSIMPDWHRSMGWNYGHVMHDEDWSEIRSKGIERSYHGIVGKAKEKVEYMMKTNQLHLLGKPVEGFDGIKKVESKGGISNMADMLKGKLDGLVK